MMVQNVPENCVQDSDRLLGSLPVAEIQEFVNDLLKACGQPEGKQAIIFRCDSKIYVISRKSYFEKCQQFFADWTN